MKRVLLVSWLITLGSWSSQAATSAESASTLSEPNPDNTQGVIEPSPEATLAVDKSPSDQAIEPGTEIPDSSELKKRDLGDAFKIFRPSEAISADNAVPFPIDI